MEKCPCERFDPTPEMDDECVCGHVLDEHNDAGVCQVEIG